MKYLPLILITLASSLAFGQIDRSSLPKPGPAPEIKIGEPYKFKLKNGLQVFVVENDKLPQVTYSLILDRDPIVEGDKAGYVSIAGQMLRRGTTSKTKEELDEAIDFLGASVNTSSTGISASGLSKYNEELLQLMTDILFNPSFPEEELEKIKKQTISGIQASKDNPSAIASLVRAAVLYGKDHPSGESETEQTISNIGLDDVKQYYNTYFKPNIAYLAVVGNVDAKATEALVKQYFGDWEKGKVPSFDYETPAKPDQTTIALVDRPQSVQSNIIISNLAEIKTGDDDVVPATVMNRILGGGSASRLFMNLREDKGYTYGAYSSLNPSFDLIGSFTANAEVRNEVTDSAIYQFLYEFNQIRSELVTDEELADAKNFLAGSFGRQLESPATVAQFALNTAIYGLPEDYYATYLQKIEAVTKDDVQKMALKYIQPKNAYITIVGKKDDIYDGLKQYGKVELYDINGDPEKAFDASSVDVTADMVIDNYIKAIGGREKLAAVESMTMEVEVAVRGMTINQSLKKDEDKFYSSTAMGTNVISKMVYNEGQGYMVMQGNRNDLTEAQMADMKISSLAFPEIYYDEINVTLELDGIKKVGDEEAYRVKVTYPSGTSVTEFFSTTSGLKLKTEGPQNTEYSDYREVEGILIPFSQKIGSPMGSLDATIKEVKFNVEIPETTFAVE